MERTYYVYILECSDGSFYIGVTSDLVARFEGHQEGIFRTAYTHSRRPVKLVYYEEFDDIGFAITREKQLKKWVRRKKIALIKGQESELIRLAKRIKKPSPSLSS